MRLSAEKLTDHIKHAITAIGRDIRSGQIKMLVISTSLGVAAISSVGFLSNRIEAGLERDARQMLGGDAVVTSSFKTPEEVQQKAKTLGLQSSQTLSFPTMARIAMGPDQAQDVGETRLVALKAVDSSYPLRGELRVQNPNTFNASVPNLADLNPTDPNVTKLKYRALNSDSKSGPQLLAPNALIVAKPTNINSVVIKGAPSRGEVWVEQGLLEALQIQPGAKIWLGQGVFKVAEVLTFEPDKGVGFMSFAPRVLINREDLQSTQLVQPTSRINWRFAVAGNEPQIKAFSEWVQKSIEGAANRGMRLETLESGRPEVRQTLDRASKFLRLVALLSVILSAVAIALAARNFSQQHIQDCAMRRVLGQSQQSLTYLFVFEFILLGLFSSLLGLMLGYSLHYVFVQILSGLVDTVLPAPSFIPVLQGLGVGLCSMLAFGLPPVLQLASVPALQVIRQELGELKRLPMLVWFLGTVGLCLLMTFVSQDFKLALSVVGGFVGAVIVFAICSKAAIVLLNRMVSARNAPIWLRIATRQMHAKSAYSVLQISALAVGLLALLLLILLRTDLIQSWRDATPKDAPNRFVINIQSDQESEFKAALTQNGVHQFDWYPMIKGRLISINNQVVTANRYKDERAQHLVDREFNLSHSDEPPANNKIVAGRWTPNEVNALSIEEGIAKTLELNLGDQLRFDISGFVYEAKITSVRKVDWTSMRTNFFVILPLKEINDLPKSYIVAFKAPEIRGFDNKLVHLFPNVTEIDIASTLNQIQSILEQVTNAVEFLFLFTLCAGLTVLVACIHSTLASRTKEYALIRAMGGSNLLLVQIQRAELWGMGALAGLMASLCASLIGWGLATYVFEFEWMVSPLFILFGIVFGVLIAWGAGWFTLRGVLKESVVNTLRRS